MTTEEKMMFMFITVHGELPYPSSFAYEIKVSTDDGYTPIGISCMKDGEECWWRSKEDILFDYLTRRMM